MKFRRLDIEELNALEPEFIQFLSANTVTAADWEQLKSTNSDKANQLIEVFSDVVFEKIIKNIEYLEFKTVHDVKVFHCTEGRIYLKGLQCAPSPEVDLRDVNKIKELIASDNMRLQVYTQDKPYAPDREQELFRMIQHGATISKDGQLFRILEELENSKD